jgi:hypothetical protein
MGIFPIGPNNLLFPYSSLENPCAQVLLQTYINHLIPNMLTSTLRVEEVYFSEMLVPKMKEGP